MNKHIERLSWEENIESRFNSGMTPKLWCLVAVVVTIVTAIAWVVFIMNQFVAFYG